MSKEMLINVSEGEECRIALLEDGRLEELYMERNSSTSHVGNIYKGKVTNVEPSIQAAFVDFGLGRNGFLHISDLLPQYFGRRHEDVTEAVGRKMARRDRPPIQRCLRRGDEIIVQIIKEGIGTKGPTLSTYLSIPGRILVMMPGMASKGVSRKIEDDEERRRLRKILDELQPPKECGFIIRTAGIGKSKADIERDLKYLTRLWETISKKRDTSAAPVELYTEGDLVTRSVRDVITADLDRVVVDNEEVAKKIREFMKLSAPRGKNRVELYQDPVPLFHKYGIEREIEQMYSRHVPLPGGGSLVIDSTEAVVAIDINSGKFRDHSDAETTAFKTDMEAADEIARQLKLRDLGGVIICDFIDLRYERHRRQLEERLHENLQRDKAKTKVLRMSQFGIIEMTRQRMRPSLKRSVYFDCPHCKGTGLVKTPESMSLDVMRRLTTALHDSRVFRVELTVNPDVAFYMLNRNRASLTAIENETGKSINISANPQLALDEDKIVLFDARDGLVYMQDLGIVPELPSNSGRGGKPASQPRRDERRPRQQQSTRPQLPSRGGDDILDEDLDSVEESIESRDEDREESPSRLEDREPDTSEHDDEDDRHQEVGRDNRNAPRRDNRPDNNRRDQHRPIANPPRPQPQQQSRPPQQSQRNDDRNRGPRPDDRNRGQQQRPDDRHRQIRPAVPQTPDDAFDDTVPTPLHTPRPQPSQQPQQQQPRPDQLEPGQEGDPTRRRRRRRRGGRGRGRGANENPNQPFQDQDQDNGPESSDEGEDFHEVESDTPSIEPQDREEIAASRHDAQDEGADHNVIAPAPEPIEDTPLAPVEIEPAKPVKKSRAKAKAPVEPAPKPKRGGRTAKPPAPAPRKRGSRAKSTDAEPAPKVPTRIPPQPVASEEPPKPVVRTGSTDRHQLQTDTPVNPEPVRRPRSYRDLDEIPDDFD